MIGVTGNCLSHPEGGCALKWLDSLTHWDCAQRTIMTHERFLKTPTKLATRAESVIDTTEESYTFLTSRS